MLWLRAAVLSFAGLPSEIGIQDAKDAFFGSAVLIAGLPSMLRLAELIIFTARFKDAHGLPAILLALSRLLLCCVTLAALLLHPDSWPRLMDTIPKLLALAFR